jgi:hypothetical protein
VWIGTLGEAPVQLDDQLEFSVTVADEGYTLPDTIVLALFSGPSGSSKQDEEATHHHHGDRSHRNDVSGDPSDHLEGDGTTRTAAGEAAANDKYRSNGNHGRRDSPSSSDGSSRHGNGDGGDGDGEIGWL